jgi:hypothetical protein
MKKFTKGFGILVVAVALLVGVAAPTADALTQSEADAIIAALGLTGDAADVINALVVGGSSDASSCDLASAPDMTLGSTGASVVDLQEFLVDGGYLVMPAGVSMGYFGSLTQSALASYQAAMGISPAAGYFGPITRGSITCEVADDMDDSDDSSSDLGGEAGEISNIDETSSDDSDVNENETAEILAFEFEVEGDVEVNRVDFYLESDSLSGNSEDADDYFKSATLIVDGEEVATEDVDEWDEDDHDVVSDDSTDEYRVRFSGLELVFEDGDEPEFILQVEANKTIDSGDQDATWTAELDEIRYRDGEGYDTEESSIGISEDFGIESEETAALEVNSSNDDPEVSVIEVDDDQNNTDFIAFVFEIEETNDVAATITELSVIATTTGTTDEAAVIEELRLLDEDGDEIGSENVPTGGAVTFENISIDIDGDETITLQVEVVVDSLENNYVEGTTVQIGHVTIDEFEDENGNDENDSTPEDGTFSSEAHVLRTEGLFATADNSNHSYTSVENIDTTNADNEGVFTFDIDVIAFGEDAWVVDSVATTTGAGIVYSITGDSFSGTTTAEITQVDLDNETTSNSRYEVSKNETGGFTLEISLDPSATGYYGVELESITFSTGTATGATTTYSFPDTSDFELAKKKINN